MTTIDRLLFRLQQLRARYATADKQGAWDQLFRDTACVAPQGSLNPCPAPRPAVGQVWVWLCNWRRVVDSPSGGEHAGSLWVHAGTEAGVQAVQPAHMNQGWYTTMSTNLSLGTTWPPKGAVLVAGPGAPWLDLGVHALWWTQEVVVDETEPRHEPPREAPVPVRAGNTRPQAENNPLYRIDLDDIDDLWSVRKLAQECRNEHAVLQSSDSVTVPRWLLAALARGLTLTAHQAGRFDANDANRILDMTLRQIAEEAAREPDWYDT